MPQEMLLELNMLPTLGLNCRSQTRRKLHFKVVLRGELGSTSLQQQGKLVHFCILLTSRIAGFDTSLTRLKLCHHPSTVYDSLVTRQCCSSLSWASQKLQPKVKRGNGFKQKGEI